jgi:hypothetical protein
MKNCGWVTVAVGVIVTSLFAGSRSQAQCVAQNPGFSGTGAKVQLVAGTGITVSVLEAGADYWESCPSYGVGLPTFTTSAGGAEFKVEVKFSNITNFRFCGVTSAKPNSRDQVITIYPRAQVPNGTGPMTVIECDGPARILGHELGHVLGLLDRTAPECLGFIMGPVPAGSTATVQPEECQAADEQWETPSKSASRSRGTTRSLARRRKVAAAPS